MPKNPFSIWSESVDGRKKQLKEKCPLTPADTETIERIIRGESAGIHFHKLKGTNPTVYSAYRNTHRRLIFTAKDATLVLVDILENHDYASMNPDIAELFYQKSWDEIRKQGITPEPIASIQDFIPTPDYHYQEQKPCVRYHQKFITLDDTQEEMLQVSTPAVIIGDPGSGKSSLCSVMIENDLQNPAMLDDNRFIVYFSESPGLAEKMASAWILDHPITARQAEANQLKFLNYAQLLQQFGPEEIQGKTPISEPEFQAYIENRRPSKELIESFPFIETPEFRKTLYHEFQIITVCTNEKDYLERSHLPEELRPWAYREHERYLKNLNREGKHYDPNLLLWEPKTQPFSRSYHDEALSTSPAIATMVYRLTKDFEAIIFADPNQENTKEKSNLDLMISKLGVNGKPATKKKLGATYRLPPTIAEFANELLKIKQYLNRGKNEKNQSEQVTCIPDEHTHKGTLEWHTLKQANTLIQRLNNSNQAYVVITHPEYIEKARLLFGDRVSIESIDESRGQEFDTVVLFCVTNPQSQSSNHQQKQTLLQRVNKALPPINVELKVKPNLAKAGKVNRAFEAYMNSLYIAGTRIQRHGYIIEDGDPLKNALHLRLMKRIENSMKQVTNEDLATLDMAEVLLRAERDLAEGRLMQAKAGFLRAGKSEDEFKAAVHAKNKTDEAMVNRILEAREKPTEYQKSTSTMPSAKERTARLNQIKARDMIDNHSIKALKVNLNKPELYPLFNELYKNQPVIDWIMQSDRLRHATFEFFYLLNEAGDYHYFNAFIEAIDINRIMIISFSKEQPLLHLLFSDKTGQKIIRQAIDYDKQSFIQKINSSTLIHEMTTKEKNTISTQAFIFPFIFSNTHFLLSLFRYSNCLKSALTVSLSKERAGPFTIHNIMGRLTNAFLAQEANELMSKAMAESLSILFETMPEVTQYDTPLFGSPEREKKIFDHLKAHVPRTLVSRLLASLQPNQALFSDIVKKYQLQEFTMATTNTTPHLMVTGLSKEKRGFYLEMLAATNHDKFNALMNDPNAIIMLSLPLEDHRPLLIHILENASFRPLLLRHLVNKIENEKLDFFDLFNKKILTTHTIRDGYQIPLLFDLMQSDDGYPLIRSLERSVELFYAKIPAEVYTGYYYAIDYQQKLPLCFIASLQRKTSLYKILRQTPYVLNAVRSVFWTQVHAINQSNLSAIGNLIQAADTEKEIATECLEFIMKHNDGAFLKQSGLAIWLERNLMFGKNQINELSLFDLLIIQEHSTPPTATQTTIMALTKAVMNIDFSDFMRCFFTKTNLFSDFNSPLGTTTRAAVLLKEPAFHSLFLIYLKQPSQAVLLKLAKLLNGDYSTTGPEIVNLDNMVLHLIETPSGKLIINAFSKLPTLMDLLDKRLRDAIQLALNPPAPSVARHGLFASTPQPTSVVEIATFKEAFDYIKTYATNI